MFGELIGLWCAQVWLDQGKRGKPHLVELGPGRGTLMVDACVRSARWPEFLTHAHATLVETSLPFAASSKRRFGMRLLRSSAKPVRRLR